jgi:hypothetical protein
MLSVKEDYEDLYFEIQQILPGAVVSGLSALILWRLVDSQDNRPEVTIKHGTHAVQIENVKVKYAKKNLFELGVTSIETPYGNEVLIQTPERAISEIWRGNSDVQQFYQYQALRAFLEERPRNIQLLRNLITHVPGTTKLKNAIEVIWNYETAI